MSAKPNNIIPFDQARREHLRSLIQSPYPGSRAGERTRQWETNRRSAKMELVQMQIQEENIRFRVIDGGKSSGG